MGLGLLGGIGMGLAGGLFGRIAQREAQEQQFQNEKEMMGLQYQYNEMMAANNQQRAKEMWDYTNLENQVKHARNAGLSIGLMYGGGGSSGTTSGGSGSGVSGGGSQAVQAGLQAKVMGLQLAQIASQVALNQSQTEKNKAEADKTKGVDTELTKTTIESLIAETDNKKMQHGLIAAQSRLADAQEELAKASTNLTYAKADEVSWNIFNLQKGIEMLSAELDGLKIDNAKKKAVFDTEVEQAKTLLKQMTLNLLKTEKDIKLTDAEIDNIVSEIQTRAAQVAQGWKGLARDWNAQRLEAQKIINAMDLGKRGLDQQGVKMLIDFIIGFMNVAKPMPSVK